jgi:hypothetical protein
MNFGFIYRFLNWHDWLYEKLCPSKKRTYSQQDFLFANPLAATHESPYLSTTNKEVKYCDHAIIIVSCVYIEFREVVILIAILTIVWFLI